MYSTAWLPSCFVPGLPSFFRMPDFHTASDKSRGTRLAPINNYHHVSLVSVVESPTVEIGGGEFTRTGAEGYRAETLSGTAV